MYVRTSNLPLESHAARSSLAQAHSHIGCSPSLRSEVEFSLPPRQGRILSPFMYKVYINSLLKVLIDHCYAISINRLSLPSPSFADDISMLALYPSFLLNIYEYLSYV